MKGRTHATHRRRSLVLAGVAALVVTLLVYQFAFERDEPIAIQTPLGLIRNDPGAAVGYTLFGTSGGTVFLIDNAGRVAHQWELPPETTVEVPMPELLPNGQLMVRLGDTVIGTLGADGKVLWCYESPSIIHHDHMLLPNGNVLLLLASIKSPEEFIAAGANPAFVDADGYRVDHLVEIRPELPSGGEVVWRWSPWDHLVQDFNPDKPNYGVPADHPGRIDINFLLNSLSTESRVDFRDWLHTNAIDFHAEADHVMFLARNHSELWVVDHSTTAEESAGRSGGRHGRGGDLLWRWGNPRAHGAGTVADQQLFWPHAAHWIPAGVPGAGNILLFNNGDEFGDLRRDHSDVLELTYPLRDVKFGAWPAGEPHPPRVPAWRYVADPPDSFSSLRASNAQRLWNGNTLIVSSLLGTLFEVTAQGEEVWRYVSPVVNGERQSRNYKLPVWFEDWREMPLAANLLYRAFRYPPEYPGLRALDLTPKGTLALDGQPSSTNTAVPPLRDASGSEGQEGVCTAR